MLQSTVELHISSPSPARNLQLSANLWRLPAIDRINGHLQVFCNAAHLSILVPDLALDGRQSPTRMDNLCDNLNLLSNRCRPNIGDIQSPGYASILPEPWL